MKTHEQIITSFRESDMYKYHPVTARSWEMTKDDIESFILDVIRERDREVRMDEQEKIIKEDLKGERNRVIHMIRTEERIKFRGMIEGMKCDEHISGVIAMNAHNAALDKLLTKLESLTA